MWCALALVMLLDVSGSISDADYAKARDGKAAALEAPEVVAVITPRAPVAVALVEFDWAPRTVLGWTVLRGGADARELAGQVRGLTRSGAGSTATGRAVDAAVALLADPPCEPERQLIDVVTDGPENSGRATAEARDEAFAAGVRINVLAVRTQASGDPAAWARDHLVTPDGFVMVAESWDAFPAAMRRKLRYEAAGTEPETRLAGGPR